MDKVILNFNNKDFNKKLDNILSFNIENNSESVAYERTKYITNYKKETENKRIYKMLMDNLNKYSDYITEKGYTIKIEGFESLYKFINKLPLDFLLNVEVGEKFNCIRHSHLDYKQNANIIYNDKDKIYLYHCYECQEQSFAGIEYKNTLNAFDLLLELYKLNTDKNYHNFEKMILLMFNIEYSSIYSIESKKLLKNNIELLNSDFLDLNFTDFNEFMEKKKLKDFYITFLNIMEEYIPNNAYIKDSKDVIFFASYNVVLRRLEEAGHKISRTTLNTRINTLCFMGLIKKVEHNNLNKSMYDKLLKDRESGKFIKDNNNYNKKNLVNFYLVVNAVEDNIIEATERIEDMNNLGLVGRKVNKKTIKETYGQEFTNSIYKNKVRNEEANNKLFIKHLNKTIDKLLLNKKYTTQKDILAKLDKKNKYWNKKNKIRLLELYLPSVLKEKGLIIIKANDENKKKYKIDDKKINYKNKIIIKK